MFDRFTDGARRAVVGARVEAQRLGHPYIGSEHLLLGLVDENDGVGGRALIMLGASAGDLRARIASSRPSPEAATPDQLAFDAAAKRLLERSLREAIQLGDTAIDTDHLALALARRTNCTATRILSEAGIERKAIRARVLELRGRPAPRHPPSRRAVTPVTPATGIVSVQLSPAAREMLAWSARHALQLGLGFAGHGPLPLRMLGGAGSAVLRGASPGSARTGALGAPQGLTPAACSFCGRTSPGCGSLLRGATGALICASCVAGATAGEQDRAPDG